MTKPYDKYDLIRGEKHKNAKLTDAEVILIRASSLTKEELGKQFNIHPTTAWKVKTKRTWRHI
jgi:hypothetical protein